VKWGGDGWARWNFTEMGVELESAWWIQWPMRRKGRIVQSCIGNGGERCSG